MTETMSLRDQIECMRLRPLLQGFLDGELPKEDRLRFATHLEACRRCGLELATYRALKQRLSQGSPSQDDDAVARLTDFTDQLLAEEGPTVSK